MTDKTDMINPSYRSYSPYESDRRRCPLSTVTVNCQLPCGI